MKVSKNLPPIFAYNIVKALSVISTYVKSLDTAKGDACGTILAAFKDSGTDLRPPKSGFIAIFNNPEKRVKYNSTNGLSFVISTGLIRAALNEYILCCSVERRDFVAGFVVLDMLRYLEETNLNVIEFTLGAPLVSRRFHEYDKQPVQFPLCDRYQEHSWNTVLKTTYPSYDTSADALKTIFQAEYNIL